MRTTSHKRNTLELTAPRVLLNSASSKFILFDHNTLEPQLQKNTLFISPKNLEAEIKMYEWRQKTQLPIVKINSFKASITCSQKVELEVQLEVFPVRLSDLKDLPLFKTLYLLKQSIIGIERLYAKIGAFMLTPKMIALNQNNKCKVWCCQNFASNNFEKTVCSQGDLLRSLFTIFEQRAKKNKNSSIFFKEFSNFETFCQALNFIENYARQNKVNISSNCKVIQSQKIISSPQRTFDASMTMSKAPNFLMNTLGSTLSPKNQSHILAEIRHQCASESWENSRPRNLQLKTSGDTAADLNSKKSSCINQDELVESLVFNSNQTNPIQKKSLFTRKYSEKQSEYKIHCSFNEVERKKDTHQFKSKDNLLGEGEDEEENSKIKNLFSTNNWKVAIEGLFGNQEVMKKSFHNGKETRKEKEYQKLQFLDKIGKEMIESCIHEE